MPRRRIQKRASVDVLMPDGTLMQDVPAGTSHAQLMAAYQKSLPAISQAGNQGPAVDAATQAWLRQQPTARNPNQGWGPAALGVGLGLKDLVAGPAQMLGKLLKGTTEASGPGGINPELPGVAKQAASGIEQALEGVPGAQMAQDVRTGNSKDFARTATNLAAWLAGTTGGAESVGDAAARTADTATTAAQVYDKLAQETSMRTTLDQAYNTVAEHAEPLRLQMKNGLELMHHKIGGMVKDISDADNEAWNNNSDKRTMIPASEAFAAGRQALEQNKQFAGSPLLEKFSEDPAWQGILNFDRAKGLRTALYRAASRLADGSADKIALTGAAGDLTNSLKAATKDLGKQDVFNNYNQAFANLRDIEDNAWGNAAYATKGKFPQFFGSLDKGGEINTAARFLRDNLPGWDQKMFETRLRAAGRAYSRYHDYLEAPGGQTVRGLLSHVFTRPATAVPGLLAYHALGALPGADWLMRTYAGGAVATAAGLVEDKLHALASANRGEFSFGEGVPPPTDASPEALEAYTQRKANALAQARQQIPSVQVGSPAVAYTPPGVTTAQAIKNLQDFLQQHPITEPPEESK